LKRELENQSLVLSEAKRREKEAVLARKQSEYQSRVEDIWGPKGRATMRNQELVKNVIDKVKKLLDTMAQKENYTLILDAASDLTFLANPRYESYLSTTRAGAVVVDLKHANGGGGRPLIMTENPYLGYVRAIRILCGNGHPTAPPGVHPGAIVAPTATLGAGV